jgi:hypothetical protein
MNVKLFGKEPALVAAFLQACLALVLGLGVVPGLTNETAGLITAAGAAVFGAYAAFAVKENLLPAIVAAFQALAAVAVGFGLDALTPELTSTLTAVLAAGLGLFLRTQATPKAGSPVEPTPVPVVEVSNIGADFDDEDPIGDSDLEPETL